MVQLLKDFFFLFWRKKVDVSFLKEKKIWLEVLATISMNKVAPKFAQKAR